ncbi:MAG: PQQ-dependent sugar dehydrogenase [Bacteroidota bacterium]
MMSKFSFLFVFVAISLLSCGPQAETASVETPGSSVLPAADPDNGAINVPDGFGAVVVADSLGRVRHIDVRDNGDIFVNLSKLYQGKGVLALRDTDGDGHAETMDGFGNYRGTGLQVQGNYLYAASDTCVYRYAFAGESLLPDTVGEKIVGGFPVQGQHASKTFAVDPQDNLYVNVGAPSNACQQEMRSPGSAGLDPCPQLEWQAGIWQFSASKVGQTQQADGKKYATGIRNAVAIEWSEGGNSLFAAQHGRDDLHRLWPETFAQEDNTILPAEEFLQVSEGDDFGWPYCFYNQEINKKLLNPEYGGDGVKQGRCEGIKEPALAFPGHLAPNDLLFYTGDQFPERYKDGAFIAFHGSWNRLPDPQEGYMVVFIPMNGGKVSGDWEVFAHGFKGMDKVMSTRDAAYRPTGLAEGPDGSLYITDDAKGRIWRVMYYGKKKA